MELSLAAGPWQVVAVGAAAPRVATFGLGWCSLRWQPLPWPKPQRKGLVPHLFYVCTGWRKKHTSSALVLSLWMKSFLDQHVAPSNVTHCYQGGQKGHVQTQAWIQSRGCSGWCPSISTAQCSSHCCVLEETAHTSIRCAALVSVIPKIISCSV